MPSQSKLMGSGSEMLISVFEDRLRDRIRKVRTLAGLDMTEQWQMDVVQRDEDLWVRQISGCTRPELKVMLGRDCPPTIDELLDYLPVIGGTREPGVYIDIIVHKDVTVSHKTFLYVGSATATDGGLRARTAQHLDSNWRKSKLADGKKSFHYSLLEERYPGVDSTDNDEASFVRSANFRQLAVGSFGDYKGAAVLEARKICVFAEAIYMAWLRSYSDEGLRKHAKHVEPFAWPFVDLPYAGTNGVCPLKQNIRRPEGDAVEYTDEARRERERLGDEKRRNNRKGAEKQHEKSYRRDYYFRVTRYVDRMKRDDVSKDIQDAFKRLRKQNFALKPKLGKYGTRFESEWSTGLKRTADQANLDTTSKEEVKEEDVDLDESYPAWLEAATEAAAAPPEKPLKKRAKK